MAKTFKSRINSRAPNDAYRDNFDRIFGKKEEKPAERPCWETIPGNGFDNVMFCKLPKGHEGVHQP